MKKHIKAILTAVLVTVMLLSICVSAASEYITATKAENPPVAMKITWNGESGQAEVYVRPVGEAKSDTYDGLYDFHNIGGSMYLPMRKICERLGEIVDWDATLGRAYVVRGENKIDMTGVLVNGTTFIKIRDFEKLGYLVDYYVDEEKKPWATLFARPEFDAASEENEFDNYVNYREALSNSYTKLTEEKELTVAYLGGSITYGTNYTKNCWRTMFDEWLRSEYPDASITMINAGYGGTGSSFGAYRVDEDVLAHNPDLVFIEYAVNDNHFASKYGRYAVTKKSVQEFYETIILKIYEHNPETDIVMVYTQTAAMKRDEQSTVAHEELAEYYNINSVYFGCYLNDYIKENSLVSTDYIFDGIHPNDKGYALMMKPLVETFENTLVAAENGLVSKVLPEKTKSEHVRLDAYRVPTTAITFSEGWTISEFGCKSTTPGATLSFKFTGDEVGVYTYIGGEAGSVYYRMDGGSWTKKSLTGTAGNDRIPLGIKVEYGEHTFEIKVSDTLPKTHTVDIKAILIN